MKTFVPTPESSRAPALPHYFGPGGINGSGQSGIKRERAGGALPVADASRAAVLPAISGNAMPRYALAVLALAIAMFALSFMHFWKDAEFAAAMLFGLTLILLLLGVVSDGNKSPL